MSKKSNGGGSDKVDGRRNNKPPEHGKIKTGEVRNRWGRKGKPLPNSSSPIDDLLWEEAARIVSWDGDVPVDIKRRLVQEDLHAAVKGDVAARVRMLTQLHEAGARIAVRNDEAVTFVLQCKERLRDEFYLAELMKRPFPDVTPHPEHVDVSDNRIMINGPTDRRGRKAWEVVKSAVSVAACLHDQIRKEHRERPTVQTLRELKAIEKHRRWLMRAVPKGWNCREQIRCVDGMLDFTLGTVRDLKEIGYVPSDNLD